MTATSDTPATEEAEREPSENLVAQNGFPHAKVHKTWDALIKYAKSAYKDNRRDFSDALRDLCGPPKEEAEGDRPTRDKRFFGPVWSSDFLKLVSFFSHRNPRAAIKAAKGKDMKPLADATAAFSDRSAFETGEREQDALAIAEGICRNHGYVRAGWDRYRWLPTFKYVRGEVMLDPDCEGDIKAAAHGIEEVELPLAVLLSDESIPKAIRDELRMKKDAHRKSRVLREGALAEADAEKDYAASQDWDTTPEMAKVTVYRIYSLVGVCPGMAYTKDRDTAGDDPADDRPQDRNVMPGFERVEQGPSMHAVLRAPPEVPEDASPEATGFDPLEHGRRVYILMVAGFNKILKVQPWPLDFFDRDELPWVEFRPINIPGLLHGMNIYRMIRPYARVINDAIEFWVASERRGAKRVVLVDENISQTELEKLENDEMYAVLKVPAGSMGGLQVKEFAGRLTSFKDMIPFFMKMHDDTTGINEAVTGRAPIVEETASAAKMRQDQAVAALSYIENAVDSYHERKTRMRVAALQRYVERETKYATCEQCEGFGVYRVATPDGEMTVPCETCRGSGRGRILQKGADFWLEQKHAEAWRDDLSLEEIRGEVIVSVELGSSRTDYAERQVALLTTFIDRWAPIYLQFGLGPELHAAITMHKDALGVSNGDALVPDLEALQQAMQAQQEAAAAAAGGGQKAGKSPEEIQGELQAKQHAAMMAEREAALEEQKAVVDSEYKAAQIDTQRTQAQIQAQSMIAVAQIQAQLQRELAQMNAQKPVEAPPLDPNKEVEIASKSEIEHRKLDLAERQADTEIKAVEDDAAARAGFAEAMSAAGEVAKALGDTAERLASVADTLTEKLATPDTLPGEAMQTLKRIEAALAADKEVVRDEFGRMAGTRIKVQPTGEQPTEDGAA